jgi:hypothetical protein
LGPALRSRLFEVKKPEESKGEWDLYKLIATVPGDEAFRPLEKGGCPLVSIEARFSLFPRTRGAVGWAKARRAVPTISAANKMVGTRSLSSGAHSRDPLALPTLHSERRTK